MSAVTLEPSPTGSNSILQIKKKTVTAAKMAMRGTEDSSSLETQCESHRLADFSYLQFDICMELWETSNLL